VRQAIEYEVQRQAAGWREDPEYVLGRRPNENRGWNADRGVTEYQRPKEAAHDYRYFPDPDLVPVELTEAMLAEIRGGLVELPIDRRRRFIREFALSIKDADTIVEHRATADLFERVITAGAPAEVAGKQFVNVWLKLANDRGEPVTELGVSADRLAELARIASDGTVSRTAANQLAEVMLTRPEPPRSLANELGLIQVQDTAATSAWVEQAFTANVQAVHDALENPKKLQAAAGFLRGQVMKISGGKADPRLVGTLIEQQLAQRRAGEPPTS
jgi:aspartyl-tRNA(Asn)/glutamyl-tRNA(Gln) amidotransferase subunit B